jgi:hypothetical protein
MRAIAPECIVARCALGAAIPVSLRCSDARSLASRSRLRPAGLTWFDLTPFHGVLELHERLAAAIALALHIVVCSGDTTFAWWESDHGGWLGWRR